MGIHIIWKAELKNLSTRLLKWAFLFEVPHRGDGDTLRTEPPGEFQDMLIEFQGLFSERTYAHSQKGRETDFEIKTDPNGKIPFRSPYHISPHEEEELRRQIDKVNRCSWIQPSRSNFGSLVLSVAKPDGILRTCIDYRAVNAITIQDRYPLPHIEDLLNSMHGSCLFTKLDLVAGYHQIRIATADTYKTAFTTKFGLYKWRVLPFGLAHAPSQFMRMMNGILEAMKRKFIVVYLDDIMIHSHTLVEHVAHVCEVRTLLMEYGLKAKRARCAWVCQKVNFCGFDIDEDGIHAQEHKTRAVMDWPEPENSKDIRGFLSLTSYCRKFIVHYAHITMPLYAIGTPPEGEGDIGWQRTKPRKVKCTPFAWDKECEHAFDTLKKVLCNAPVLALPDPEAKYCLHVDGSQYALGAVLSQMQDKTENVLGYFSCKSHDAETRYPAYTRELLGIQDTLLFWKFNLHGAEQPFLVHTDHATLHWILTQPHLTIRQMDILTVLQNCDWEVKHVLGVKNQVTDMLSRRLDFQRQRCNVMAMEVTAAGELIEDIKVGIVDDKWFRPMVHSLGNSSPHPLPCTASAKEWPTVVTWRFGKETGGEKGKGKEEGRRGSGDNGKGKREGGRWKGREGGRGKDREGGREKGREGGRGKGREERTVVYSKDDAASNPP